MEAVKDQDSEVDPDLAVQDLADKVLAQDLEAQEDQDLVCSEEERKNHHHHHLHLRAILTWIQWKKLDMKDLSRHMEE